MNDAKTTLEKLTYSAYMGLFKIQCGILLFCSKGELLTAYAPINSKLQHPPARAYPGHLTVDHARGGGNLNVALEGWGI